MRFLKISAPCLILMTAVLFAKPVLAQAPNAFPITNVNLRAGPGVQYPVILTVPTDAPITILGCLPDYAWCDTVFQNYRGWMSAVYLSGYYEGDYYLLRDYAPDLGYRPVTFNISAYWGSYYRDQPFYGEIGRWEQPYGEGYVNNAVFYDRLQPYGSWTWIQGRYVWVPGGVGRDWRPYTRGRWVYTNRGWTWVSNEPYGWATYHYGRWGYSDRVGWFWVPGNQWAPAWVSWRQSDDYLGWAPLPPSYGDGYGYDRGGSGININISFGNVPDYYWSIVPSRDFLSNDLDRYYVRDRGRRREAFDRTRPIGHTKIVNKTVVNNVVNVTYVEQKTETKVVEKQITTTDNAEAAGKVEGDTLEVYEPKPDETQGAGAPPEPKDVKTVAEESETKGQAKGEATTEEMLAPKDVQEAAKERKGKGRKAKAEAEAKGETLPEGEIVDTPPPSKGKAKEAPVPAEEVATPKAEEPEAKGAAPEAKDETPKPEEAPEAKDAEQGSKKAPETEMPATPEVTKPEGGPKEKPGPKEKDADKAKTEKPAEKEAAPTDKAPDEKSKEPLAPKTEGSVKEEKPEAPKEEPKPESKEKPKPEPKAEKPEPPEAKEQPKPEPVVKKPEEKEAPEPKEPKAEKPETKEPEAKTLEPKQPEKKPEAKEAPKPEPKKLEPKQPEKKPEPKQSEKKQELKKPEKKPEAKKPEGKKPEAKKIEKHEAKPQAKKVEPKSQAKKAEPKLQAKKAAPKKQEAKKAPVTSGPPKREAKKGPPPTKASEQTAQASGTDEKLQPKKKKKKDDDKKR